MLSAVLTIAPRLLIGSTLVSVWLCACSGNGIGLDSNGQPLSGAGSGTLPLSADFDSIQENVFTPICSVCHAGAGAPEGLMLDAEHSYNLLVNVPSTEVPSLLRVHPGDPTDSYIIQKLEGHAAVGGQMPLGEAPLPAATIAFIAQWITDGALPGAMGNAMASEFRVVSVAPEDESAAPEGANLMPAPPAQMVIGFSRELDATRVDAQAVRVERVLDPGAAQPFEILPMRISVPSGNPRALLLTPLAPMRAGHYRIVLSGAPGVALAARDGTPLAGAGAAASADQIVSRFTVAETP